MAQPAAQKALPTVASADGRSMPINLLALTVILFTVTLSNCPDTVLRAYIARSCVPGPTPVRVKWNPEFVNCGPNTAPTSARVHP